MLPCKQVLPVSDTSVRGTWRDSYPYSALCVFALHPLYLRLQALSGAWQRDRKSLAHGVFALLALLAATALVHHRRPSSHTLPPTAPADDLPADIRAEIDKARVQLEGVEEGVDYEGTMQVGDGRRQHLAETLLEEDAACTQL
jgi:hypothetical protein